MVILKRKCCRCCFSRIHFHEKYFVGFHVDHEIDSEVSFVILFAVEIIPKPLSDLINFASYFPIDFFILEVILSKLVSTKTTEIWSQFLVSDDLGVHRTQSSAELPCDCANSKGFQFPKRHYFFGATVLELV